MWRAVVLSIYIVRLKFICIGWEEGMTLWLCQIEWFARIERRFILWRYTGWMRENIFIEFSDLFCSRLFDNEHSCTIVSKILIITTWWLLEAFRTFSRLFLICVMLALLNYKPHTLRIKEKSYFNFWTRVIRYCTLVHKHFVTQPG